MRSNARYAAGLMALVLISCLTGCDANPHPIQPQKFAPPVSTVPKPQVLSAELPESVLILPTEPEDTDTDAILEGAAKPATRRRKTPPKPAAPDVAESAPAPANPAPASGNDSGAEVPAIGNLTSGESTEAANPDLRRETADSISDTEKTLRAMSRPLSGPEQKTAAQIRQFIREARKALTSGDVDGASTLAAKAKVLLGELNE